MVVFSRTPTRALRNIRPNSPRIFSIDLAPSLVRTPRHAWISTGPMTRPSGWDPCIFSMTARVKVRVIRAGNKAFRSRLLIVDPVPAMAHPLPPPEVEVAVHRWPDGLLLFLVGGP